MFASKKEVVENNLQCDPTYVYKYPKLGILGSLKSPNRYILKASWVIPGEGCG